jgi:hypothetical protein
MKVIVTQDFYDLKAFCGRRAGDVIEVPEDRGARLIEIRFAKAEGVKLEKAEAQKPEKAEAPKAKPDAKKTAKKL